MRPDDDDIPEFGGGPPPDPSMRQWRHPSEIAAAASAAARPDPPTPAERRRRSALVTTMTVGIVATAVVGLGAVVVATMGFGSPTIDLDSDDPTADAAESALEQSAAIQPTVLLTTTAPAISTTALATTSTTAPTTTEAPPTPELAPISANGVYAGGPPPQLEAELEAELDGELEPESGTTTTTTNPWLDADADAEQPRRLGNFVVVNDYILTSASLVKGHDDLHLVVEGQWVPVQVRGQDSLTDLALLQIVEGAPAIDLLAVQVTWSVDGEAFAMPDIGSSVYINGVDETMEGAIVGPKDRVVTPTGEPIYGAWLTSVQRPTGSGGAAATDAEGVLLGLVVNSPDFLASVVSVETMLEVSETLNKWGRPTMAWLGIESHDAANGGLTVDSVDEGGPAAAGGLQVGDRIVAVNDKWVHDHSHFRHLIRRVGVGGTLNVTVDRDGKDVSLSLTVGTIESLSEAG